MKKITIYLSLILLLIPAISHSTRFTIVKLIPNVTLKIGEKLCGIGDDFDDRDTIFWNNEDTLVMNVICSDRQCKVLKQTIFYPQDLLLNEQPMSLHTFLFAQIKPLVGYASYKDTLHIFPYGATSLNLFSTDFENVFVREENSNFTFELQPIDNQYFLFYGDFIEPSGTKKVELFSHPNCKAEHLIRALILKFED